MSRGPGQVMRRVLALADERVDPETGHTEWVSVADAGNFPPSATFSDASVRRAMRELVRGGVLEAGYGREWRKSTIRSAVTFNIKNTSFTTVSVRRPAPLTQLIEEAQRQVDHVLRHGWMCRDRTAALAYYEQQVADLRGQLGRGEVVS